jgi:hypothetical protein
VIEGKAKRYKLDDGVEATQQYSAAQVRGARAWPAPRGAADREP